MRLLPLIVLQYYSCITQYSSASYLFPYDPVDDCQSKCEHKLTNKEYEHCLVSCKQPHLIRSYAQPLPEENSIDREYPSPPADARVDLSIVLEDNIKYIQATVKWTNRISSVPRRSIYLSFVAMGVQCERHFAGYYSTNIPSNANIWVIPLESKADPLTILHDCTYRVELHSVPYIYRDPRYTTLFNFTVPKCVEGFCDCRAQRSVPGPKNVKIESFLARDGKNGESRVSWEYSWAVNEHNRVEFHIYLAKLLKTEINLPISKLFVSTPVDIVLEANQDQEHYAIMIPEILENGDEYQIQVFALNDHICRSKIVEKEFIINLDHTDRNSSASESTSTSEPSRSSPSFNTSTLFIKNSPQPVYVEVAWNGSQNITSAMAPPSSDGTSTTHLFIFFPIIMILVIVIGLFLICKVYSSHKDKMIRKQKYMESLKCGPWANVMSASMTQNLTMETNILYLEKEIVDAQLRGVADKYEISYERLKLGRVIGQGAFGLVHMGNADSINGVTGTKTVAVKQLKVNADEDQRIEFVSEICMMKHIGSHPNIVQMYACCTLALPHCMVMEYVPYGDLQAYLRNLRKEFDKVIEEYRTSLQHDYVLSLGPQPLVTPSDIMQSSMYSTTSDISARDVMTSSVRSDTILFMDESDSLVLPIVPEVTCSLDPAELQSFSMQVANGMTHLEGLKVTHRDLAARNILVGHGKVLKISDFGLSRSGIYVKTTGGRIPLRWLSTEAMRDHVYTTKSDVWAYGIVLWEICTLGGFPYPTVNDKDLLRYLEAGKRLAKPSSCSDEIYKLMNECWSYCPNHRPSFGSIKHKLDDLDRLNSPYVEFNPLSDSLPSPSNMSAL